MRYFWQITLHRQNTEKNAYLLDLRIVLNSYPDLIIFFENLIFNHKKVYKETINYSKTKDFFEYLKIVIDDEFSDISREFNLDECKEILNKKCLTISNYLEISDSNERLITDNKEEELLDKLLYKN